MTISRSSVHRILREQLQLYPYKIQLVQELKLIHLEQRVFFAENIKFDIKQKY